MWRVKRQHAMADDESTPANGSTMPFRRRNHEHQSPND
jgi:hypothetical protein